MYRMGVVYEVEPRPWKASEKLTGRQISFQAVAATAGENEVAGIVGATFREREDVVQRGGLELETRSAVHAAAAAIPHGRTLESALLVGGAHPASTTRLARDAGEGDAVIVPTAGHFTSLKKKTPRDGTEVPSRGVGVAQAGQLWTTEHMQRVRACTGQTDCRCRTGVLIRLR